MFAQLVKHEFNATRRIIPFIYLVTAVMIATSLIVRNLNIGWLSSMLLILLILLAIVEVVVTYALLIHRYYKNLYNAEGYLMHTLPVKASGLLYSKLLVAFIWLVTSYILLFAVIYTVLLLVTGESGFSPAEGFRMFLQETQLAGSTGKLIIIAIPAYLFLAVVYQLAQIYFAITMGSISRLHHLGLAGPIVVYLILYFILQIWVLIGLVFIPFGLTIKNGIFSLTAEGMLSLLLHPETERFVFGLGSILFIAIAIVFLLEATRRLISRHTSLR